MKFRTESSIQIGKEYLAKYDITGCFNSIPKLKGKVLKKRKNAYGKWFEYYIEINNGQLAGKCYWIGKKFIIGPILENITLDTVSNT